MKKRFSTKFIAAFIAIAVAATGVSGCTSGKGGEAGTSKEAGTEVLANNGEHPSWVSDKQIEVSIMMMDSPSQPLKNEAPAHEEITNKTNVKLNLQIVPSSSYKDKKNILLGTNNFPDIVYLQGMDDVVTYAGSGIFEPLSQYVNETDMPNLYKFWQQYPEMKKYLVDGELYVFPVVAREESANGAGPVIREDLLKSNNLETPETFDELLDVLKKLKEIYPDSIPWTTRKGTANLLKTASYMLGSGYEGNGLYYDYDLEGGKYVFGPASENFKEVLKYLNKAYEAGVLDPDFATNTAEQMESKLSSGKSFFFLDNSGFGQNYTKALRKLDGNQDATMQIIPIPQNSFGQKRAMAYATELPGRFYALNAKAKNKKEIIKFIDWMYSKEGSDITNYGVEGKSFEYNDKGEPEFKKDYVMQFKDAQPSDYYAVYADLGITKLDWSLWACNTKTWFEIQKLTGNWDDTAEEYWDIINQDKAYVQPHINPPLTKEETESVNDILVDINTMLEQEFNKYIMGEAPIEDWDKVIAQQESMGVRELEKIYNEADQRALEQK
jgi:ABC-type glycerol-3-phosphate transport system substrate-binding protein